MQTMTEGPDLVYVVVFACTPGAGSEEGVGWEFVLSLADYSSVYGSEVIVVTSSPHARAVEVNLLDYTKASDANWRVRAVPIPSQLLHHRSPWVQRAAYLVWQFLAVAWIWKDRARAQRNLSTSRETIVHHLTYATEAIPTFEKILRRKSAWVFGPAGSATRSSGNARLDLLFAGRRLLRRCLMRTNLRADVLVATNDSVAMEWLRLNPAIEKPLTEPNITIRRSSLPQVVDWSERSYDVAIVGVLERRKLVDSALRSVARVGRPLSVVVIGDGPEAPRLRQIAEGLDTLNVSFSGRLSRAETLSNLSRSRLLVHASMQEGSPWVVGEAQALGVTPVVFPAGGADTVVALGELGFVASNQTESGLASAIACALDAGQMDTVERWNSERLVGLLHAWYGLALERSLNRRR